MKLHNTVISMFSIELIVINEDIETIREKFRS